MKPTTLIWMGSGNLLAGLLLVVLLWTGYGDSADCGTWGFSCVLRAAIAIPFTLMASAVPLTIGAIRLPRTGAASILWRCVAAIVATSCLLAFACLSIAWAATSTP